MTIQEALAVKRVFNDNQLHSEEDIFRFTEAMQFLIRETKDTAYMMELGGYYYEWKHFDLALKYYEMAAALGDQYANVCLGYIWYYGRTGERDYEKAFHYYSKAMEGGDLQAAYKVADMYKNGYYVEKDYDRYCSIIEDLYTKIPEADTPDEPLPEIYSRLARIRMGQGRNKEAVRLLRDAKNVLEERLYWNPYFGNLNIMKWLMGDLYRLSKEEAEKDFDLYNLYVVLLKPAKVTFRYGRKTYEIQSVIENGECVISFGGRWFRNVDDFFAKAQIDGDLLTSLYEDMGAWEVTENGDH